MTAISFNKGDATTMTAESARKMLASLLAKIQNGAAGDIGPADLDRLRAVASSSDHHIASTIPDLDRKYLRSGRGGSSSGPAIVRVVGMVKDQMDPEFYQERVANKSSKYRDYVYGANDAELELDPTNLAERQPLFVVPLPFSSQWFRDGMIIEEGRDGDASDAMQVEDVSGEDVADADRGSKRSRPEGADANGDDDENLSARSNRKLHQVSGDNCGRKLHKHCGSPRDWWPEGCMGSDPGQVPVLAKVYYNEDQTKQDGSTKGDCHLRLNDIVSMVGVVHFDPMEADFSAQEPSSGGSVGAADNEVGCEGLFDDMALLDGQVALPPPSILPRLHVLTFQRLDLDTMADSIAQDHPHSEDVMDDRTFTIKALSEHIFGGKTMAGEALLLTLLSMAERDGAQQGRPLQTPSGSMLGCASLNFAMPGSQACKDLRGRLGAVLRQLLPVTALADLSLPSLTAGVGGEGQSATPSNSMPVASPIKTSEGRIAPSLLQLPKGACLVINQGSLVEGRVNDGAYCTLVALSEITKHHMCPYRFDGMMDFKFEADIRCIVISRTGSGASTTNGPASEDQNKLLPCAMRTKLSAPAYDKDTGHELSSGIAKRIRTYLAKCRASNENFERNNIGLSRDLLLQAEKDFVKLRVASRENQDAEIGEEDFHRWLTMTRLQARSRIGVSENPAAAVASLADWTAALELDAMMKK